MIFHVAVLLCFQLLGVILSRLLLPILPGPVLGLVLCLITFIIWPRLAETVRPTANGILSHLSLLFVPAGVGVVSHWQIVTAEGPALPLALVVSTVLALIAGAAVFVGVARLVGAQE